MKVEVLYYSRGGRTKKVAEAIAHVFGVGAKDVRKDAVKDFDLLFVGSGNYGKKPAAEIVEFLGHLDAKGKKAAVFGTYGGSEDAINVMKSILESKGAKVLDTWGCRGKFFFIFNRGRPNEEDVAHAKEFAEKIRNSVKA